ncbi:MAG: aminopeptidase P family N-terminal domain-containing protein [Candidatus Omnitrophica bacterium]|nr:aminopeptidase P family N-terminal domain-containing protein [Candidatus Omnitrophota bacterium]
MEKYYMPDDEFKMRWEKAQEKIQDEGLDLLLAHSNESDFANVRYLSDYWPIFESAGVIVPLQGNPALLIGPESETFASDRSRIKKSISLSNTGKAQSRTILI